MFLNTIQNSSGAYNGRRVGRGIGSGLGKTCGRGHKGQKSRAGGYHKIGFEGGQMPLQRRLPKRGFNSLAAKSSTQITLSELNSISVDTVDLVVLKKNGLVSESVKSVKVISSGYIKKSIVLKGIQVTRGAKKEIEAVGGKIE